MDRAELESNWAATAKHLNAARNQVPKALAPGAEGATVTGFEECLRHDEMELALDELEDLGLTNAPPPEFWRQLVQAAENMGLSERATDFERRMGKARGLTE
jgi:hypothetical protein